MFLLNMNAIGSLIAATFMLIFAIFLLTIKNRSETTRQLGLSILGLAPVHFAYMVAAAWYHPWAAYHRWFTIFFVIYTHIHIIQFIIIYPYIQHSRLNRIFYRVLYGIAFATIAIFIALSFSADFVFHAQGELWDIDLPLISGIISFIILVYFLSFIGISIWKFISLQGKDRWVVFWISLALLLTISIPMFGNILSKSGSISHALYMFAFASMTLLGFFIVIVIYINVTHDRTTFIAKIIGITLVTILLLFQWLSFIFLYEKGDSFDRLHLAYANRAVRGQEIDNLRYLIKIPMRPSAVDLTPSLPEENKTKTGDSVKSPEMDIIYSKNKALDYLKILTVNKIMNDAKQNWDETLNKIQKSKKSSNDSSTESSNQTHKGDTKTFNLIVASNGRQLRSTNDEYNASKPARHFVAYQFADIQNSVIYEMGYEYLAYREYLHESAVILTIILVVILLIVLFLFPYFFRGSLVLPLQNLLEGLRAINDGNLNTHIKPRVQDEIGFLTNTFNDMTRTIRNSQKELQDYAQNLEKKVDERTAKLKKSFEEINALKQQQDGDYFLTSLLIKPLGINEVESDIVTVDFLVKQKKQFQFRKWEMEIGGDICIANTIRLRDKQYTVFLNGDAMGKSAQGASGALVLGVVFRSFVSRTKMVTEEQNRTPEQWLKDCFVDLQKVFESFDGSMLISVAMGLVDELTGLMYYLNAEHPWTVLYRNGKASFIEQELLLRKIGTTGLQGSISIQILQLQQNDVIIAGSDGRDDILLGQTEGGHRIINENENLFLQRVETGQGHLEKIEAEIRKMGELTDDLSLLRIEYKGRGSAIPLAEIMPKSQEFIKYFSMGHAYLIECKGCDIAKENLEKAYEIDNNFPMLIKDMARLYLRRHEYAKASEFADRYIYLRPDDSVFIYLASIAYKRMRELKKAADLGEMLRLRRPLLFNNLVNLADVYRMLQNYGRSRMLIEQVLQDEPDNRRAKMLLSALENIREG